MKLSVGIPAIRKGVEVKVTLSAEDGALSFEVPSVARSATASFVVEEADLREALKVLGREF